MARCVIFMNHHVHEKKPTEPVITIDFEFGNGRRRIYCNMVRIKGTSVLRTGENMKIQSHVVKAWLECDFEDVEVIE